MRITKSREFLVSMGNYENVTFGTSVEISDEDFPKAKTLQDLDKIASEFLDQSLEGDIEEARLNTAEPKSFIHLYQQEND
ncbi:hypothetical protein PV336_16010 [Streptomyces sp. MI02-2A]|uniref:hypothetical protein n=1 Tax=Streptomyces sp. MI02-2A TaxID=3028688 RepID=UPI0029A8EB97|nr:hypothetical protein [Streptomyces sp. MI02-2A]MDX3260725.1 hypothetical protein [Streptomyces sp. MI02-2A]